MGSLISGHKAFFVPLLLRGSQYRKRQALGYSKVAEVCEYQVPRKQQGKFTELQAAQALLPTQLST